MKSMNSKEYCANGISETEITFIVNNIGPDLLPLGRKLQLDVTEMTEIHQEQASLKDKAYKLINWWIQRNGKDATKKKIVDALVSIDRKDMADELADTTVHAAKSLTDFSKFQRRLIQLYSHLSVPQPPGIKKDIPIDKIFIDQEMEIMKKSKSEEKPKILRIQSLIQQIREKQIFRTLVEGDPGFGKTTLTVKLATDWATGKEYINLHFHLVLLIPLREVGEQDLQDVIVALINRANRNTSMNKEHLNKYLTEHNVLLLLDGYDEMSEEARELIHPILMKDDLHDTCILVTSRSGLLTIKKAAVHSTSSLLFMDDNVDYDFWDSRVILKGISFEQRSEILQNHFEIDSQTSKKMEELFEANANELFRCPLLVFWLGWMLEKQGIQEIQSRTSFYKRLLNLIFHKTLVRENKIKENDTVDIFSLTTDKRITRLREDICQLGKVAIKRIISKDMLFKQSDLKFLEKSLLLKSDLFIRYKTLTRNEEETYYQPMHRSFLEFLAAYSISNYCNEQANFDEFKQNISDLVKKGSSPSLDSLFFPFVAGLLEEKSAWLFQSLLPWASFNHIGKPEMMNIFLELNHIDNDLIQHLLCFVRSYYSILPFKGINQSYYSYPLHKLLFNKAVESKRISIMTWKTDIEIHPLSDPSINLHRLYLFPQNTDAIVPSSKKPNFHCKELIYFINVNMNHSAWDQYLSVTKTIEAKDLHLFLADCNFTTLRLILNETSNRWCEIVFQRVRLFKCCLANKDLDAITQLVRENRITKGISINLDYNHQLTTDCVIRLWEAVIQSTMITEFSFVSGNPDFSPNFKLSACSNGKVFQMLHFEDYFNVECIYSSGSKHSIQQLSLINENYNNYNDLANLSDVVYFHCDYQIFASCLSNKVSFLSTLIELNFEVTEHFSVESSLLDLMPSLRTLILKAHNLSTKFPSALQSCVVSILNGRSSESSSSVKHLQVLGIHFIPTFEAFAFFINCFIKAKTIQLECLQLLLHENYDLKLISNEMCCLKELLKNKNIKQLSLIDWYEDISSLCTLLPCWFSEEDFQFKYQFFGNDYKHFIWNQHVFQHFMLRRGVYYIESRQ